MGSGLLTAKVLLTELMAAHSSLPSDIPISIPSLVCPQIAHTLLPAVFPAPRSPLASFRVGHIFCLVGSSAVEILAMI